MKLSDLSSFLNGELIGDGDIEIEAVAKIEDAKSGELTFLANPKYSRYLEVTKASAIIVAKSEEKIKIAHIKVDDPYLSFQKSLSVIYPKKKLNFSGIHSTAIVEESAVLAKNISIGQLVYIGAGVCIEENTVVFPGCVLGENVKIGKNCTIHPNVTIYNESVIGDNVILHAGVVIGCDGFGYAPSGEKYHKIPQVGKVVIENDVEIGANTTIDRATIGETRIKQGCKIDNLVQVAHNVVIGENTVMAAQSGVAGSSKLGKHVTIAGQVGVVGHLEIGDDVVLAGQAGVTKNVPKGEVMFGTPAIPIAKQKRIEVTLRHLPEMNKKMHQMEKTIIELENKLKNMSKKND